MLFGSWTYITNQLLQWELRIQYGMCVLACVIDNSLEMQKQLDDTTANVLICQGYIYYQRAAIYLVTGQQRRRWIYWFVLFIFKEWPRGVEEARTDSWLLPASVKAIQLNLSESEVNKELNNMIMSTSFSLYIWELIPCICVLIFAVRDLGMQFHPHCMLIWASLKWRCLMLHGTNREGLSILHH